MKLINPSSPDELASLTIGTLLRSYFSLPVVLLALAVNAHAATPAAHDDLISDGTAGSATATVELSVNLVIDAKGSRDDLLNGVAQLADPGRLGHMVAYSISNFPG